MEYSHEHIFMAGGCNCPIVNRARMIGLDVDDTAQHDGFHQRPNWIVPQSPADGRKDWVRFVAGELAVDQFTPLRIDTMATQLKDSSIPARRAEIDGRTFESITKGIE